MTYSIVARDPRTGELGVAVQSHWFGVGALVPWARPGVGAVATQANVNVAYGPHALELLVAGASAGEALARLTAADPGAPGRQLAIIDASGAVAAHTGSACMAFAGHVTGEQVSCQANIMANATVWPTMLEAFVTAAGPLASRLLVALDAAERAGGDELTVAGRHAQAAQKYQQACELAPGKHELLFWSGLGTALSGDVDRGVALVREAIALQPGWSELLPRLTADVAPAARVVSERLGL